jgi:hypothetical protein
VQPEHTISEGVEKYCKIFTAVFTRVIIHLCVTAVVLSTLSGLQNAFLAYPQAPVECHLNIKIPEGVKIEGVTRTTHA